MQAKSQFELLLDLIHVALGIGPQDAGAASLDSSPSEKTDRVKAKSSAAAAFAAFEAFLNQANLGYVVRDKHGTEDPDYWATKHHYIDYFGGGLSSFRQFYVLEALLSTKWAGNQLGDEANGGLTDCYVFFADVNKQIYEQLHHCKRTASLLFPPKDGKEYRNILRNLGGQLVRSSWDDSHTVADVFCNPYEHESHPLSRALCRLRAHSDERRRSDIIQRRTENGDGVKRYDRLLERITDEAIHSKAAEERLYGPKLDEAAKKERACEIKLQRLLEREIVEAYLNERRSDLKRMQRRFFAKDRGVGDLAIVDHVSESYKNRTDFERANRIFIQHEGELFYELYLQRLSELYWVPRFEENNNFTGFLPATRPPEGVDTAGRGPASALSRVERARFLRDFVSGAEASADSQEKFLAVFGPQPLGIGLVRQTPNGPRLTKAAECMLSWLEEVLNPANTGYECMRRSLFPSEPLQISTLQPPESDGKLLLTISHAKLTDAVKRLCDHADPGELMKAVQDMLAAIFCSNTDSDGKLVPFTDVQLSDYCHLDPFLTSVYMANHEWSFNNDVFLRPHRYFFMLPIDPVALKSALQNNFALGIGYIELKAFLPLSEVPQGPDNRLMRLKAVLTAMSHPVVRERIESDLRASADRARASALCAATAAIMARNMSHNIGSHVLSNLQASINSIPLNGESPERLASIRSVVNSEVNGYLQARMDYIARVTSDWASWAVPMDLYRSVIEPFVSNYGLLDNIARSETLDFDSIMFSGSFTSSDGKRQDFALPATTEGGGRERTAEILSRKLSASVELNDIDVTQTYPALWVDIAEANIGCQAFYSILENVLRNSAKHNKGERLAEQDGILRIYIEAIDEGRQYSVTVSDNVSVLDGETSTLVDEMNRKLEAPFIDQNGEINSDAWGVKEMRIGAHFLALQKLTTENQTGSSIIRAVEIKKGGKRLLGYRFALAKPRSLAIADASLFSEARGALNSKEPSIRVDESLGVEVFGDLQEGLREVSPFKFLFVRLGDTPDCESRVLGVLKDNLESLPSRILLSSSRDEFDISDPLLKSRVCVVGKDVTSCLNAGDPFGSGQTEIWRKLFFNLYEAWIRHLDDGYTGKYKVHVYFQQDDNGQLTKVWLDMNDNWNRKDRFIRLKTYKLNDRIELESGCRDIYLLRHGGYGLWNSDDDRDPRDSISFLRENSKYFESIEIGSTTLELLLNITDVSSLRMFLYQFIESAVFRILIVDERIADFTWGDLTPRGEWKMQSRWKPRGNYRQMLTVPTMVQFEGMQGWIALGKKQSKIGEYKLAGKFWDRMLMFCDNSVMYKAVTHKAGVPYPVDEDELASREGLDNGSRFHLISIHKGILDKKKVPSNIDATESFVRSCRSCIPFVVVHSGRGLNELREPSGCRVLPFSTLNQYLHPGNRVSKFYLTQVLLGNRRRFLSA